jgi:hypothetical protein
MYVDITSNRCKYGRLKVHPVYKTSSERTAGQVRVPLNDRVFRNTNGFVKKVFQVMEDTICSRIPFETYSNQFYSYVYIGQVIVKTFRK